MQPHGRTAIHSGLLTYEGKRLIAEAAHMEAPVFVLTGGQIKRPDLFELVTKKN